MPVHDDNYLAASLILSLFGLPGTAPRGLHRTHHLTRLSPFILKPPLYIRWLHFSQIGADTSVIPSSICVLQRLATCACSLRINVGKGHKCNVRQQQ
jgi:hypothetical protein